MFLEIVVIIMHDYNKETLSHIVRINIKKYRKLKGLTAEELAEKADYTFQYVRDLESLKVNKTPTLEALGRFAKALDIDIRQLFDDVYRNE